MLSCKQTVDFTTCICGKTLPKNVLYGKVHGKIYTCNPFCGKQKITENFFTWRITMYNEKRGAWYATDTTRHADIFSAIEKYLRENQLYGEFLEFCEFKQKKSRNEFHAQKRADAQKAWREEKARREVLFICGAPQMRTSKISASGAAKHTFMNEGGRIETAKIWVDEKNPNPIPAEYKDAGYLQYFEMGQNTSGTMDGKYTRSGFEIKKDGLKVDQKKIRPNSKPDYMKRSGQASDLSKAQKTAMLKNKDEAWYNSNYSKHDTIKDIVQCAIKEY